MRNKYNVVNGSILDDIFKVNNRYLRASMRKVRKPMYSFGFFLYYVHPDAIREGITVFSCFFQVLKIFVYVSALLLSTLEITMI